MANIACDAQSQDAGSSMGFIPEISEVVSSQLHGGIMKSSRKVFLDEIIRSVISEAVSMKKAKKCLKNESVTEETCVTYQYDVRKVNSKKC